MSNFVRQIGRYQPGIQLNPLQENDSNSIISFPDQTIAIAARLSRGRIDGAFIVDRASFTKRCGRGESIRSNAVNESYSHMQEAVDKGAIALVVSRLHTSDAELNYIVVSLDGNNDPACSIESTIPETPYVLAIKHLNCHNDGIQVRLHAPEAKDADGVAVAADYINLSILDSDGEELHEFSGSLDPESMDDFSESNFIENKVSILTDEVEVTVGSVQAIPVDSSAYGRDANGYTKEYTSGTQIYFTEGGTGYSEADYQKAKDALRNTRHNYTYVSVGGSTSAAHISLMAQLCADRNAQLRFDVPGKYTPAEAIQFVSQFNLDSHLVSGIYWSPIKFNDPSGLNGKFHMGTATRNMAYACARNARTNAKGFAPKHFAIAMKDYPIDRAGAVQTYDPSNAELDQLAQAKITPVLYRTFEGGGAYVYTDSLTAAKTLEGYKKFNSVVDMSTHMDTSVVRKGQELLQMPIQIAIKRMGDYLKNLLEGAESAGWLVPSEQLGGASFAYTVQEKANRIDCMDVRFIVRYQGTVRQIEFSQTITR